MTEGQIQEQTVGIGSVRNNGEFEITEFELAGTNCSQKITTEEGSLWCHAILTVTNYTNNPALISRYSAITPVENMSCPVLLIYETVYLIYNSEF